MKNKLFIFFLFSTLSFYGQNDTISVVKHTTSDIIFPKELKVVYRGIPNSLSIEVHNCRSFTAIADGLTKLSKNLYNLNPIAGSEVIITVDIVLKNGKRKIEKHNFKIKNTSGFVTSINHLDGKIIRLQKSQLNNAVLSVDCIDKNLKVKLIITRFVISLPGGKNIEVNGNSITNDLFKRISNQISIYDIITISDIKVTVCSSFLGCIRPAPIQIEIF